MSSVKDRIIEFSKSKGISNRALSTSIGMSPTYINSMRKSIQPEVINRIVVQYPELNIQWLLTGEGEMLNKKEQKESCACEDEIECKPHFEILSNAGETFYALDSTNIEQCEHKPIIRQFPLYDCTMFVSGNSMFPEFHSGDLLALRRVPVGGYIEPGRVYVINTVQGVMLKKVYIEKDCILCRSINAEEYPEFRVNDENAIFYDVVGHLRID